METLFSQIKLLIIIFGLLNMLMILLLIFSVKKEKPTWYSKHCFPNKIKGKDISHDVLIKDTKSKKHIIAYYDYANERWELINYQIPPEEFIWRYIEIEFEEVSE